MHEPEYTRMQRERGRRNSALRRLGFSSYDAYLKGDHWRERKAAYRASDRPQRCICGEYEGLQLHHITYERLGAELLDDLRLLCAGCHTTVHILERRGDSTLDPSTVGSASPTEPNRLDNVREQINAALALPITDALTELREIADAASVPWVEISFSRVEGLIKECARASKRDHKRRHVQIDEIVRGICQSIEIRVEGAEIEERELATVFDQSRQPTHPMIPMDGTMSGRWAGWRTEAPPSATTIKRIA